MYRFHLANSFDSMQREAEQLLRSFDFGSIVRPETARLQFNLQEQEDSYMVEAPLPGIDVEKLDISVVNRLLTIKGEFAAAELADDVRFHRRERRSGTFEQTLRLPADLDADAIAADYQDGILSLRLPKAQAALPRRIEVKVG
ncbi:MAG: Hsp20/alpha crystallin family protein [Pelovirga sp.]